jgi:hypothetical protein
MLSRLSTAARYIKQLDANGQAPHGKERRLLDENEKKQIPLRLSASLWKELVAWAEEDFRSLNGQIEYLLTESVRRKKKSMQQR